MQIPRQSPSSFTPAGIMAGSKLFRDYQRAFASASGLLPVLRNADSTRAEALCSRLSAAQATQASVARSCAASQPCHGPRTSAATQSAPALQNRVNLQPASVPVRIGKRVIALLQIEQVHLPGPIRKEAEGVSLLAAAEQDQGFSRPVILRTRQARAISSEQCASLAFLLGSFAPQLADWYLLHGPTEGLRGPAAVLRAKKWLMAHYHEPVTMSDVARAVHLRPEVFCRSFHREVGDTFTEFIARMRVVRARRLLASPGIAVKAVALASGFSSISQFNRVFHNRTGLSPTKYRLSLGIRRYAAAGITIEPWASKTPVLRAAG